MTGVKHKSQNTLIIFYNPDLGDFDITTNNKVFCVDLWGTVLQK